MKKSFLLLASLFLSFSISLVHAEPFDLMELPAYVDAQLGVGTFVAGMLISMVFLVLTLLPLMVLTKGKQFTIYIIVGMSVLAPLVGLGWFPIWIYIIIVLLIALGFGQKISDAIGGLRK